MTDHVHRTLKIIGQLRFFSLYELCLLGRCTGIATRTIEIFGLTYDGQNQLDLYAKIFVELTGKQVT